MRARAPAGHFRRTVELVVASGEVDSVIIIFIPPLLTEPAEVARAVGAASDAARRAIVVLTVFMSAEGSPPELRVGDSIIPNYAFPEDAARALGRVAEDGRWRGGPAGRGLRRGGARA